MVKFGKGPIIICVGLACCLSFSSCSDVSQDDLHEVTEQGYYQGFAKGEEEGYERGFSDGKEQALATINNESEIIETPYYSIEFPSSWEGTYEYTYQEGFLDIPTMAGYAGYIVTVTNKADEKTLFTVSCGKEEYTGVGNGWFEVEIGRTTIDPQYKIFLGRTIVSNVGDEKLGYGDGHAFGPNRTNEYINYIFIK